MIKVNYIIATLGLKTYKNYRNQNFLQFHIDKIFEYQTIISQISIIIPIDTDYEEIENYYSLRNSKIDKNIKIKYFWVSNCGYSYGQFLKAFQFDKQKFDYYFLVEDDYAPSIKGFDKKIIDYFDVNKKDESLVCGFLEGNKFNNSNLNQRLDKYKNSPECIEGFFFLDYETFYLILNYILNQYNSIDNFFIQYKPKNLFIKKNFFKDNELIGYLGGYYQLIFSELLYNLKIFIFDITSIYSTLLYFDSKNNILQFLNRKKKINNFSNLFSPILLTNKNKLRDKELIIIIGMHRSGTSLMSSIISSLGYSLGKNINKDKDYANSLGYYENDEFTKIHDQLFERRSSSWNKIIYENFSNFFHIEVEEYINLILNEFDSKNKILIKDPRASFLLPLILTANNNLNLKFIVMKRNKNDCIKSLMHIHNIDINDSKNLYDLTYQNINKFINSNFIEINYEDFGNNFQKIENKLINFLNIKTKIENFYKPAMHRFNSHQ